MLVAYLPRFDLLCAIYISHFFSYVSSYSVYVQRVQLTCWTLTGGRAVEVIREFFFFRIFLVLGNCCYFGVTKGLMAWIWSFVTVLSVLVAEVLEGG